MRGRLPKVFTYTGTAAALQVVLGFRPKAILVINETDGDTLGLHIDNMTAGTSATSDAAVAAAADGFTFTDIGFKLSTNAKLNESAKVYKGIAF